MAFAGSAAGPFPPEGGERVGFAEVIGRQLQEGFGTTFGPELFRSFHPTIDLLDRRFDVAAGDRQAQATVGAS